MSIKRSRRKALPQFEYGANGLNLKKNDEITADPVRLATGDTSEIVPLEVAMAQAREAGLDLVEVASNAAPPVCRLMDYEAKEHARFKSQAEQHEKTRQRQREASKAKEIRVGCSILDHDLKIKLHKIDELLDRGHRVTVSATYEISRGAWKQQYPKAIEVAKRVWQDYSPKYHSWFDYSASGNKQISIVFSPTASGRGADPFPWDAGSKPPPFMIKMQEEAAAAAQEANKSGARGRGRAQSTSSGRPGGLQRL